MHSTVTADAADLLSQWLDQRLDAQTASWLTERVALLSRSNSDRDLHITLGMIPRKLGRADLAPDENERQAADNCRTGWDPRTWSIDTAARVMVLCRLAEHNREEFGATIKELCRTADVAESIAMYAGFAVFPDDPALDTQVGEGLRTNMRAVFESIAHYNPFPREHFDQNRWNHMVLKALFVDSELHPIQGLDERANAELATILCNYAHERWAAKRPVTPELWRCVGPFADDSMLSDLERVITSPDETEQQAGVLAASASPAPAVSKLTQLKPSLAAAVESGQLTWNTLGENT